MTLSMVPATPYFEDAGAGDRVTPDGTWSLTHEIGTDDDTGDDALIVVATHLETGLQLTHDLAGVDDWLMSGVALDELREQAEATVDGFATDEAKAAARRALSMFARAALVKADLLLPAGAADTVEYRCECGGFLAMAPYRILVHVDACRGEIETGRQCDPGEHRFCLTPAARICGHALCHARACAYAPDCDSGHDDCCGSHDGNGLD